MNTDCDRRMQIELREKIDLKKRNSGLEAENAQLQAELEKAQEPDWLTYIGITKRWLEHYPEDIFTGVSGDPGPLFVVAVRKALEALTEGGTGDG